MKDGVLKLADFGLAKTVDEIDGGSFVALSCVVLRYTNFLGNILQWVLLSFLIVVSRWKRDSFASIRARPISRMMKSEILLKLRISMRWVF